MKLSSYTEYLLKILYYLSLGFAVYYLYRNNFLDNLLQIENYVLLGVSVVVLFAAQMTEAACMQKAIWMQQKKHELTYQQTMVVFGKTIFAKYIPGKIFLVLSLVFYLNKFRISKTNGMAAMLNFQIISLWSGLIFGLSFILAGSGFSSWLKVNALIFLLVFAAVFLLRPLQRILDKMAVKILRREVSVFHYPIKKISSLIALFLLTWLLNGVGFYLLTVAKTGITAGWQIILIFPLARTIGTLAIVTPGGLGVREGVIATLLALCGMTLPVGVAVSVLARIWFFFGELFSYLAGIYFEKRRN